MRLRGRVRGCPDGVAGGVFVDVGFKACRTAGADHRVVKAWGHLTWPEFEEPVGEGGKSSRARSGPRLMVAPPDDDVLTSYRDAEHQV